MRSSAILFAFLVPLAHADSTCVLNAFKSWQAMKAAPTAVAALPEKVDLPTVGKKSAQEYYDASVHLLRTGWNPSSIDRLRDLAQKASTGTLSPTELKNLETEVSAIRAPMKTYRFMYEALDKDHEIPGAVDELTISVGKFRDAVDYHDPAVLKKAADRLLGNLQPDRIAKVEKQIANFEPASRGAYEDWVKHTLKEVGKIQGAGEGTADEFHSTRKALQAILAVTEAQAADDPQAANLHQVAQYLFNETEKMGTQVGAYEDLDMAGKIHFNKTTVTFPAEIRQHIMEFLNRVKVK